MVEEEQRDAAAAEERARHEEAVRRYQREMGRAAAEERVDAFVAARTRDGDAMVDPTGREFRINPSEVTAVKSHAFGLGRVSRARPDIVAKVRAKPGNEGVAVDESLLPKPRAGSAADPRVAARAEREARAAELRPPVGHAPGANLPFQQPLPEEEEAAAAAAAAAGGGESGGEEEAAAGEGGVRRKFPPPTLSKLEQRYMAQARERQRANITQKQVVWGREFKGRPFLAKPEALLFEDFEVGVPMRRRITLTNVSYTFNSFKLLHLPDAVRNFFEIRYTRPGRMSAGMACPITVTFTPKVDRDIETELPCLASTGPFAVPVRCYTKKARPAFTQREVDFGDVVLGEAGTVALRIANSGALQCAFALSVDAAGAAAGGDGGDEAGSADDQAPQRPPAVVAEFERDPETVEAAAREGEPFGCVGAAAGPAGAGEAAARAYGEEHIPEVPGLRFPAHGAARARGSTTVAFRFRPIGPGRFEARLRASFDNAEVPDQILVLRGRGLRVPIYVQEPALDFGCVCEDDLYRARLVLRNRAKTALKVQLAAPPPLARGAVDFSPSMGFVQARDPHSGEDGRFEVNVRFRPSDAVFRRCVRSGHAEEGDRLLEVPVEVGVPDQTLPVFFTFRARITTAELEFSPPRLAFGRCITGQDAELPLLVRNPSLLPQRIAFVQLPRVVAVSPDDGFATLLPGEERELRVRLAPESAVEYSIKLRCVTSRGRDYRIPCTAAGENPALRPSHTVIRFPATPPGDRVLHSLSLTNQGAVARTFEVHVPMAGRSHLRASPQVATVAPGQTCRVELEFAPPASMAPAAAAEAPAMPAKLPISASPRAGEDEDGGGAGGDAEAGSGGEEPAGADAAAEAGGPGLAAAEEIPEHFGRSECSHDVADPDAEEGAEGSGASSLGAEAKGARSTAGEGAGDDEGAGGAEEKEEGEEEEKENAEEEGETEEDGGAGAGAPAEPWSVHSRWLLPVYVRDGPASEGEALRRRKAGEHPAGTEGGSAVLHVQVETTVVERVLASSHERCTFGEVAVGQTKVITVRLTDLRPGGEEEEEEEDGAGAGSGSAGEEEEEGAELALTVEGLRADGTFAVLNPLRPLGPGGVQELLVQFRPFAQQQYADSLVVRSARGAVRLALLGRGVSPELALSPADGVVDVAACLEGATTEGEFALRNTSAFELGWRLRPLGTAHTTYGGGDAFACVPAQGRIAAGQETRVRVLFSPDHERPGEYAAAFAVDVPNQAVEHRVLLRGRCWARQLFAAPASRADEPEEGSIARAEALLAPPPSLRGSLGGPARAPRTVRLRFARQRDQEGGGGGADGGEAALPTKAVRVGATAAGGGGGSFEVRWADAAAAAAFGASPERGTLGAGEEQEVAFTFDVRKAEPEEDPVGAAVRVGQWVQARAEVVLRGGFVPPGEGEELVVAVVLEGFARR